MTFFIFLQELDALHRHAARAALGDKRRGQRGEHVVRLREAVDKDFLRLLRLVRRFAVHHVDAPAFALAHLLRGKLVADMRDGLFEAALDGGRRQAAAVLGQGHDRGELDRLADEGHRRRATCLAVLHIYEHKKTPCKFFRLAGCHYKYLNLLLIFLRNYKRNDIAGN